MNTGKEESKDEVLVTAASDGRVITRIGAGDTATLQVDKNGDLNLATEDDDARTDD